MTAGLRRLLVASCCVVAACSPGGEQGSARAPKPDVVHDVQPRTIPAAKPVAEAPAASSGVEAASATAKPVVRRPALVQGLQLAAKDAHRTRAFGPEVAGLGRRIWNADDTELALDVGANVRIVLAPKTELWAFVVPDSLVLVSGTVWVQRSPAARRAGDTPVRLATLAGSLELTGPAELWLRSESRRATGEAVELHTRSQLALSRGAVTWSWRGPDSADQPLQRATLSADAAHVPALAPLQLLRGRDTSQRAQAFRSAREQLTRRERFEQGADRSLEAALDAWLAERASGALLLAQSSPHYARIAAPDSDTSTPTLRPSSEASSVRAYQHELASHAQRTLQARQLLRLATEQSLAVTALECAPAAQGCAALERWAEHFRPRLGEVL